ncbi:hypothetical protein F4677DRAFT_123212 [Hypoxylon crocopeplum]|nr:hypothetical protein F4677DRAFT_123212 [Hypoxylon crocopeplum]
MNAETVQEAAKARERVNDLYRKGQFSEAVKAYEKAAQLVPSDPYPLSNLSAAHFEAGRYSECVNSTVKALGLLKAETGTNAPRKRLLVRQAKAYLHLSRLDEAEEILGQLDAD